MRITIEKLVHGGQGLGTLENGQKVFVWNALPGEIVEAEVGKSKRSFAQAIATEIISPSPMRIRPREPSSYLSTSPWQICDFDYENDQKLAIVREVFDREHIQLPHNLSVISDDQQFGYRNKMEFSFYGDENGLHLAFYNRGTHQKQIVNGSELASPAINEAALSILGTLNASNIRAGDLKSIVLRSQQDGKVVAALFTKLQSFPSLTLPENIKGLRIYHSNPKSPASVATKLLKVYGDDKLYDIILGKTLEYDVTGFFQVNLPVFVRSLESMRSLLEDEAEVIDLYSGVGSIGLNLPTTTLLVELDVANAQVAKKNAGAEGPSVVTASAEQSLEFITSDRAVIVDPPRAGLHQRVVERLIEQGPPKVCYLSCNPATQARDVRRLVEGGYKVSHFEIYNFFPRTPHIESLSLLSR